MKKKLTIFAGTRPEIIKVSELYKNFQKEFKVDFVFTGQHKETADILFNFLKINPTHRLDVMKKDQSLSDLTSRSIDQIKNYFLTNKTDMVLVQGDTTTAYVSALIAFYNKIPVGHVEAGLRTNDKYSPFPEEINRRLISCIAELNFCPTQSSANNLLAENIDPRTIFLTGNSVIDALLASYKKIKKLPNNHFDFSTKLDRYKNIILVTCHRRENIGKPLRDIIKALKQLAKKYNNYLFFLPVHPNPHIKEIVEEELSGIDNFLLTKPLSYEELIYIISRSKLILSDSGGIQEEAPSLNVPVLVLRESTERPEGIDNGNAVLVGSSCKKITHKFDELIKDSSLYDKMAESSNPYGDGTTSIKIKNIIHEYFNRKK